MKLFLNAAILVVLFSIPAISNAQCDTWTDKPNKGQLEDAHVLYRSIIGSKSVAELKNLGESDLNLCYDNWKTAYEGAPAADGQRPSHFSDGRKLYQLKYENSSDDAEKQSLRENILRLYDEQIQCYKNDAFLLGRKGFDMFYSLGYGYDQASYDNLKKSMDLGGNSTEYIVLEPLINCVIYYFQSGQMDQMNSREVILKALEIADYNVTNNQRYGTYYQTTKQRIQVALQPVESDIFDCDYFKSKLLPQVEENPQDLEIIKYAYNKLVAQGCQDSDEDVLRLKGMYEQLATEINAQLELERRQNNPGYDATQLQREGKYEEALARYQEAISATEDPEALAQFYYSIAFIETWQLDNYQSAIRNAREALKNKSGWGKPYILIGNVYAKMSRYCGDDWNTRMAILAAIDKYAYARSIDSDVQEEANKLIANYRDAMPDKQEGFMRQINEGDAQTAGCGIGETVKVRFKN